jgi:hypothetical protein
MGVVVGDGRRGRRWASWSAMGVVVSGGDAVGDGVVVGDDDMVGCGPGDRAMVVAPCARSVRVAYADDGSSLMHVWGTGSGPAVRRSVSERGIARQTTRGMHGTPTTIEGGAGRWRWTRRRLDLHRRHRIGRRR